MNYRDAMLGVMRGKGGQSLLFVPRLDIWYNANKKRGTLPAELRSLTLPEIAEGLGVGFHSVVPDFARTGDDRNLHHRALGFYNHPDFPYRADFSAVEYRVISEPLTMTTIYPTSSGEIVTRIRYGADFLDTGMSIPDILEPAIKEIEDYPRVAEILSKVRIVPTPEAYGAYHRRIGERGVAVAYLSLAASPMQHIMRDLRKLEPFFFDMVDIPEQVLALAETLAPLYEALVASALGSAAEVLLLGANYDDSITYPPFFEEHILPWLRKAGERLRGAGKLLLTHTDGENRQLLDLLVRSGFDIADSVCPAPMTRVTLRDYRNAFGKDISIWGGIPSILVLVNSFGKAEFRSHVSALLEESRPYDRLILSVADTLPPDADWDRILYIRDRVAELA
ncbi:MAG: hypothetical protein WCQ50_12915 [Spirochaetota bacterium]